MLDLGHEVRVGTKELGQHPRIPLVGLASEAVGLGRTPCLAHTGVDPDLQQGPLHPCRVGSDLHQQAIASHRTEGLHEILGPRADLALAQNPPLRVAHRVRAHPVPDVQADELQRSLGSLLHGWSSLLPHRKVTAQQPGITLR
jgi:hypothetical protein